MKITKKVNLGGDWAKAGEDVKDGDIITIRDAGQPVESEFGTRMVFRVDVKTGGKLLSFNQTSLNNLVDAFGDDTTKWVDKEIKVWLVKAMVSGKLKNVIYLAEPSWVMKDDGSFNALI